MDKASVLYRGVFVWHVHCKIQIYSQLPGVEGEDPAEERGERGDEEEGGSKIPELKVQKEEIRALLSKKLEKGDTWCASNV